ncbi:MAG: DegT/DnrJ/EryC1/StrS aminotransferase family protein [Rhodopirellula sp.]|nr:DegT/DnrJ/EryC1/StrS aminotransferase family protein [Rhodopirellula sp.]
MHHGRSSTNQLAIHGGRPLRSDPMPPWPVFDEQQIGAVADVLRSGKVNYWTGDACRQFEQQFASAVGCKHAVAVANGTVALELALHALGIAVGDEVLVTCRSFVASATCCTSRGALPVFADVDPKSQNVTPATLRAALTPQTKALIAVHLAGWPCEMDPIMALARERGLWVVEDCAQAQGATYRGRPVGSLGHAAAFSFCQDKILTTGGEGGMLTTNDTEVWERAWSYKDHGKSHLATRRRGMPGTFHWMHDTPGTNWRMTEMQAAIGRIALERLPEWLRIRRRNAAILSEQLRDIPGLRLAVPPPHVEHSYYKYYVFVEPECLRPAWSRDRILAALIAEGIPCGSGACPEIYLEKAFEGTSLRPTKRLPNARRLGETSLMLLVHPTLGERDILDTSAALRKVLCEAAADRRGGLRRAA